jgi:hypothetical protein
MHDWTHWSVTRLDTLQRDTVVKGYGRGCQGNYRACMRIPDATQQKAVMLKASVAGTVTQQRQLNGTGRTAVLPTALGARGESLLLALRLQGLQLTELPASLTHMLAFGRRHNRKYLGSIHLSPSNANMHVSNASSSNRQRKSSCRSCTACFCYCGSYTKAINPG